MSGMGPVDGYLGIMALRPATSRILHRRDEFRSSHDGDATESTHRQQVTTVARDNMRRSSPLRTFQNLVVIRVRDNSFELTGDWNDSKKS